MICRDTSIRAHLFCFFFFFLSFSSLSKCRTSLYTVYKYQKQLRAFPRGILTAELSDAETILVNRVTVRSRDSCDCRIFFFFFSFHSFASALLSVSTELNCACRSVDYTRARLWHVRDDALICEDRCSRSQKSNYTRIRLASRETHPGSSLSGCANSSRRSRPTDSTGDFHSLILTSKIWFKAKSVQFQIRSAMCDTISYLRSFLSRSWDDSWSMKRSASWGGLGMILKIRSACEYRPRLRGIRVTLHVGYGKTQNRPPSIFCHANFYKRNEHLDSFRSALTLSTRLPTTDFASSKASADRQASSTLGRRTYSGW